LDVNVSQNTNKEDYNALKIINEAKIEHIKRDIEKKHNVNDTSPEQCQIFEKNMFSKVQQ